MYGTINLQLEDFEIAIQFFEKAHNISPNSPEVLFNLAKCLEKLGRLDDANFRYDQALKINPFYAKAHAAKGVLLSKKKDYQNALLYFSKAIDCDPKLFQANWNKALCLSELDRYDEAIVIFNQLIQLAPDYADAYNSKGIALGGLNRYDEAIVNFDKAIQLRPDYPDPYNNRGNALSELNRYDEAIISFDQATQLRPDYPDPYNNRGLALSQLSRYDEAIVNYDQAIQLKPDYAHAYFNKSLIKLLLGDFNTGWELYEWRMKLKGFRLMNPTQVRWLGKESLINKTLLVEAEQGIGDVIQFCRYIPLLANSNTKIIMEIPKTLHSIIKTLGPHIKIVEQGKELPYFDYHIPIMSLPLAFKTSLNDIPKNIPYLFVDDQKRKIWNKEIGEQKKLD